MHVAVGEHILLRNYKIWKILKGNNHNISQWISGDRGSPKTLQITPKTLQITEDNLFVYNIGKNTWWEPDSSYVPWCLNFWGRVTWETNTMTLLLNKHLKESHHMHVSKISNRHLIEVWDLYWCLFVSCVTYHVSRVTVHLSPMPTATATLNLSVV